MKFSEVIGHSAVKQKLIDTVKKGRVSHAQLFYGPEGSGKLALALAYATYVSCTNKQISEETGQSDSCGLCPSCIKYAKYAHPDLHFFYPVSTTQEVKKDPMSKNFLPHWRSLLEKNAGYISLNQWYEEIGIENKQGIINAEDCNEIIRILGLKSYESDYKVIIIWMVEKLYYSAAPKILKILEEPPQNTLFLLVCENLDEVLGTIQSRSQLVKVPFIDYDSMVGALKQRFELSEKDARRFASLAEGNYTTAVRFMQQEEEELADFTTLRQFLLHCHARDYAKLADQVEEIAKTGREKQKQLLEYAMHITRLCLAYTVFTSEQLKTAGKELEFVSKISRFIKPSNVADFFDEFQKAHFHIERNGNAKIVFFDLGLCCSQLFAMAR